jgi:hypothetical protein
LQIHCFKTENDDKSKEKLKEKMKATKKTKAAATLIFIG